MKLQPIALAALLLGTPAVAAPAGSGTWLAGVEEAREAAGDGDRYILVDLYADWCGWCKVLEKEVFASAEFRTFAEDMVLLRVDVEDGGEGSELQARFGANSLPTTLILDADLAKVGEVNGYAPTLKFIAAVRRQLEEHAAMLTLYDKVRRSNDRELIRRMAEDFHGRGDGKRAAALYEALLDRVGSGGDAAAWLHYLSADAHRLSGDLQRAEERFRRARQLAADIADNTLAERLGMLRYYLAHDNGDCSTAMASLEEFLASHPRSAFRPRARYTLAALRRGEGMQCT